MTVARCTVGLGAELKHSGKFRRGEFEAENMSDGEYKAKRQQMLMKEQAEASRSGIFRREGGRLPEERQLPSA